jgi:aspartate kinase
MIVMKFGGSSVESAKAIQRVACIVRNHLNQQPVVVVSAMGKTTDRLLAIARLTASGDQPAAEREMDKLLQFHLNEAPALHNEIRAHFAELSQVLGQIAATGAVTPPLTDAVSSFGERLSSLIVTAAFRHAGIDAVHLDSRQVIVTDACHTQASLLFTETNALLRRKVSSDQVTVMGGFIAATEDGVPTTLGRGGSDYTAAIVGAALSVDEIQIWTDVDGMMTCDPRIVPEAHCLRSVSYSEAEQMAKAGARVLHPATVLPAVRQAIPIVICNSRNAAAPGTRILGESPSDGLVLSIACRTGVAVLQLTPRNTPVTADFANEVWNAFQKAGLPFELIATSTQEMTVLVEEAALTPEFVSSLNALAPVETHSGRALVTLVGRNVSRNPSSLVRASRQLAKIAGGASLAWCSDSRFAFVVAAEALHQAAEVLHTEFFSQPDPAYFIPNRTGVTKFRIAPEPTIAVRQRLASA